MTDQKAMNELLSEAIDFSAPDVVNKVYRCRGASVYVLDCSLFNDFHLQGGHIYHFKKHYHIPEVYERVIEEIKRGEWQGGKGYVGSTEVRNAKFDIPNNGD
jgi:hypothetical protein